MKSLHRISKIFIALTLIGWANNSDAQTKKQPPYTEDWESVSKHNEAPEWFKDAKFGIYFHWGVYSVPAFGSEWYPRNMYFPDSKENKFHTEKYGPTSKFGYHDFVPMFKAEKFNANEWAELFKKAGAQFAGPVAEHHDGFSMWASKVNPWNAKDMGPKRDIVGELEKAIRKQGMKFITTFHHERQLQRYANKPGEKIFRNSHYPYLPGTATVSTDPKLRILYGNLPEAEWLEQQWFGKLKEVIDAYHPDIVWFDSWLNMIPENYRLKFVVYYLNKALERSQEVAIVRKQNDLPLEFSVDDLEKSRKNRLEEKTWMTDETISKGSWSYTADLEIKPVADMLHVLIDVVSKNGVLLLNVSPKAEGTIPEVQQAVLLKMGEWLKKYGEAIYGTRPWYTYGEGPTKEPEGNFKNNKEFLKIKYSEKDVRYTTKIGALYATLLGQAPANQQLLLKAFAKDVVPKELKIEDISFLGSTEKINWKLTDEGLMITAPAKPVDALATTIKIRTQRMDGSDFHKE